RGVVRHIDQMSRRVAVDGEPDAALVCFGHDGVSEALRHEVDRSRWIAHEDRHAVETADADLLVDAASGPGRARVAVVRDQLEGETRLIRERDRRFAEARLDVIDGNSARPQMRAPRAER